MGDQRNIFDREQNHSLALITNQDNTIKFVVLLVSFMKIKTKWTHVD